MLLAKNSRQGGTTVAAILMLLNKMLDVAVPPTGGPQRDIDARFSAIVEGYYRTA